MRPGLDSSKDRRDGLAAVDAADVPWRCRKVLPKGSYLHDCIGSQLERFLVSRRFERGIAAVERVAKLDVVAGLCRDAERHLHGVDEDGLLRLDDDRVDRCADQLGREHAVGSKAKRKGVGIGLVGLVADGHRASVHHDAFDDAFLSRDEEGSRLSTGRPCVKIRDRVGCDLKPDFAVARRAK